MRSKKYCLSAKTIALLIVATFCIVIAPKSSAAPVTGFEPGRIIDDFVMTNSQSMTVAQIQAFLDSKVPVCDNNGTNGTTATSRAEFFASKGWPLPLKCLKEYTENGKLAAQIIYDAGIEFTINPQVLIVLLQKEQGLVTDDWPDPVQYRTATGYGCPDTAACDSDYYGFTNQVRNAAKMFRKIIDSNPNWYTPYVLGENFIYYSPNSSCGGTVVNIQNRATQGLYNYTPYQPNTAALNAGYGIGDACSAHGNRNFYQYFTDWFGSTFGVLTELQERYGQISGQMGSAAEMGYCNPDKTLCWQRFAKGYMVYGSQTGTWESKGAIRQYWASIGYQNGIAGLPIGPEIWDEVNKTWSQKYQNGIIIGTDRTGWKLILNHIDKRWQELGATISGIGLPTENPSSSGNISWQGFSNGYIIHSPETGTWESKGAIRAQWANIGYQNGVAKLPIGPEVYDEATKTWSQEYEKGIIIGTDRTGYWFVPTSINARWQELGGKTGMMGMPKSGAVFSNDLSWQELEKGYIISSPLGVWESKGAIRAKWGELGYQNGELGLPNGPEVFDETTGKWSQDYMNGTITYSDADGWSVTMKDM